jgi:uncharacterized protein (TIGR03083 family)
MGTNAARDQWDATRTSMRDAADRFADLVLSAPRPGSMATAHWSVADTAAHVVTIASLYTSLVRPDEVPLPIAALADHIPTTTVDTVAALNEVALSHFTERDPQELVKLLRASVDQILRTTDGRDPMEPVDWLGESRVPLAGVLAHLINELLIHGRDIARATGSRWVIAPQDAALFFDLFLVGVVNYGYGRLADRDEPPPDRRIAVEFRSRYTTTVTLVLHHGRVTTQAPGGDIDVRLSFDPTTLNLMLFGRVSRPRALLTGKVVVRGRRPWLLPAFLRTVRLPS